MAEEKKQPKKKKRPSNYYVDKEEFYQLMVKFKDDNRHRVEVEGKRPIIPDSISKIIMEMSERTAYNWRFRNKYPFQEDMVANAIETCIRYIWNFDEIKYRDPFAYFNMYIFNAFIATIKKEKKQFLKKVKYVQNIGIMGDVIDNHFVDESHTNHETDQIKEDIQKYFDYELPENKKKRKKKEQENLEQFL